MNLLEKVCRQYEANHLKRWGFHVTVHRPMIREFLEALHQVRAKKKGISWKIKSRTEEKERQRKTREAIREMRENRFS